MTEWTDLPPPGDDDDAIEVMLTGNPKARAALKAALAMAARHLGMPEIRKAIINGRDDLAEDLTCQLLADGYGPSAPDTDWFINPDDIAPDIDAAWRALAEGDIAHVQERLQRIFPDLRSAKHEAALAAMRANQNPAGFRFSGAQA